ncbi:MAG TPA: hypothetical protein ENF51_01495 [Candidatus Aenigmarchaeota archaeon]|nr:hypothetical protein [Candidatus Aenigmarchaeota archaeon]
MRAQFMMGGRTKFLLLGLLILLVGGASYANKAGMLSLPFSLPEVSFEVAGFSLTLELILILLGFFLILISRLMAY